MGELGALQIIAGPASQHDIIGEVGAALRKRADVVDGASSFQIAVTPEAEARLLAALLLQIGGGKVAGRALASSFLSTGFCANRFPVGRVIFSDSLAKRIRPSDDNIYVIGLLFSAGLAESDESARIIRLLVPEDRGKGQFLMTSDTNPRRFNPVLPLSPDTLLDPSPVAIAVFRK